MRHLSIFSTCALALALVTSGSSTINPAQRPYSFHYENVLGTSLDLKVTAASEAEARKAEAAVMREIGREAKILSSWDADSEVSRWERTRDKAVPVSEDLFQVLGLYDQWGARTNGALNASAETAIRVWKNAAKENRLPRGSELAAAVSKMSGSQWTLDAARQTATHTGDAPLVLASFTKSFIINRAVDAALAAGAGGVVLNIGGDIAVRGAITEPVDIADPRAPQENADPLSRLRIQNMAVATSGDYRRGFDIGGHHYSHIVDPRTGATAENVISSTVLAANPVDAGALATAFSILKPAESAKLAASMPGVAYLLVTRAGQTIRSSNWGSFQMAAASKPAKPGRGSAAGSLWDPSMELTVNVELASLEGAFKRPFVVAWIEDMDHFPVKTLVLWFHEDRFLTEMKAWYRSDRVRAMAEGKEIARSISGATRPPGKYSFKWNGMDNDGQPVKAGRYTVFLELTREHGTYQLMKQQMDLNGTTPRQVQFPANAEMTGASFDYHRLAGK